jgi:hypothetical protein
LLRLILRKLRQVLAPLQKLLLGLGPCRHRLIPLPRVHAKRLGVLTATLPRREVPALLGVVLRTLRLGLL